MFLLGALQSEMKVMAAELEAIALMCSVCGLGLLIFWLGALQSEMKVMAAELVARAGEVDRLRTDLETVQAESQNLRSEVAQLSQRAAETQRRLDSEASTMSGRLLKNFGLLY